MKIIFRADANRIIGMGHIMRCLSIAAAFKRHNHSCLFVTADGELQANIEDQGHQNIVLHSRYDHMDGELGDFKIIIEASKPNILFVDSYYVTEFYFHSLFHFCKNKHITLVYIDDVLSFPYECHILLNYNIYADRENYRKIYSGQKEPVYMLGTSYAPLRTEFQNLPDRKIKEDAKDILLSTGGADYEHIGVEIVELIRSHRNWNHYRFHFIVGVLNEDKEEINSVAKGCDNITLYGGVNQMSDLMRICDVAVSASGSTLYELCSTQTPTITYIVADNQIPGAKGFEKKGIMLYSGDVRKTGVKVMAEKLLNEAVTLLGNYEERSTIAQKMKVVVDGKGAERIVETISV